MPKRFFQAPPKKKIKLSHRYIDMVKSTNGTGSVLRDGHNLGSSDKTRDDNNDETSDVLEDFADIKVDYLQVPVKSENDKKEYRYDEYMTEDIRKSYLILGTSSSTYSFREKKKKKKIL